MASAVDNSLYHETEVKPAMKISELKFLILADLYRYRNNTRYHSLLKEYIGGVGFKYLVWFRINQFLITRSRYCVPLLLLSKYILRRLSYKFGIDISLLAQIGPGFKIEHFGTIFINGQVKIGNRCSVLQGVTIGAYKGAPSIGDFSFIGPGAKLIGAFTIGKNVIIGANSVITKNVPDDAVVVGVPGKVISYKGNLRPDKDKIVVEIITLYKSLCPKELWPHYRLISPTEDQ